MYEFGGHEAIQNARMACYVSTARTHVFAVIGLLLPIYIFIAIISGARDIRQWKLVRMAIRIALAFPRQLSFVVFLFSGAILVPVIWTYISNSAIESGGAIEAFYYLTDVVKLIFTCE